jgi:ubiquinone/menaquinone biosynthesis C-methylase UbiE
MIRSDISDLGIKQSLHTQKQIIEEKINHLGLVRKAIQEAEQMLGTEHSLNWDKFTNIIKLINMEKDWLKQFQNSTNLNARIRLHDRFSTNVYGWHRWLFDRLELSDGLNILEIGCGNAALWRRNYNDIPRECSITLTDFSQGMINDAQANLGSDADERFTFNMADAQSLPFESESFDVVVANYVLFLVPDPDKAFAEMHRVLKPGGMLYASTMGKSHLRELKKLLSEFDAHIIMAKIDLSERFGLENGEQQLSEYFSEITLARYQDSLLVTDAEPLVDYVLSTSGNAGQVLVGAKLKEFKTFMKKKMAASEGAIHITKDSGVFTARKKRGACK